MDISAIDSKNAGIRNEKLVIGVLRSRGGLSQAEIAKKTGLLSSTITYIVGRLRAKGLILEKPGQSSKRGAKPILIEINPAGQFIVGTEINPSYLLTGLFDFKGDLVDLIKIPLGQDHSVDTIIHILEVNIKGLLSRHPVPVDKLAGVGITLSGSISVDGSVQLSSPLGWKNVPLKTLLASKFDCPVDVFTTKVRLLAEMSMQPSLDSRNTVYVNVGNGVGATVIVDGKLIHGATNRCGELGHIIIDSEGPMCGCGQRGCLEAHISGPAILKKIKEDLNHGVKSILSELINNLLTPEDMAEQWKLALQKKDSYAMKLRDFVADKLSRAAAIAVNLFDPDVLVLAGYINEVSSDYFAETIRKRFVTDVYDQSSRKIEIVNACAGQQALIRGVAAAVLEKQFS